MTTPEQAREMAGWLSEAQRDFIDRVAHGYGLGLADRAADKARQSMRKAGVVEVLKNPRRWRLTPLGLQVRAILQEQGNG